ncbi:MAG: HD family phosphohydrolase, partial [Armatimonadota bacterium]
MPRNGRSNNRQADDGLTLFGRTIAGPVFRRGVTIATTTLIVFLLLVWQLQPQKVSLQEGDVAPKNITATRMATYVDKEETERLRQQAASAVDSVYNRDPNAISVAEDTVLDIFAAAESVRKDEELQEDIDRVEALRETLDVSLSQKTLRFLIESDKGALQRAQSAILGIVRQEMDRQIRSNTNDLANTKEEAAEAAEDLNMTPQYEQMVAEIARAAIRPNLIYDPEKTQQNREQAAQSVDEVRRQLFPGDLIVAEGEPVTSRHIDMFEAVGLIHPQINYIQALALLLLVVALALVVCFYASRFADPIRDNERLLYTVCIAILAAVAILRVVQPSAYYDVWVLTTISALAMFISIVANTEVAVSCALFVAIVVGSIPAGGDISLMIASIVSGLAAAQAIPGGIAKYRMVTRAALMTGLTNGVVLSMTLTVFGMKATYAKAGLAVIGGVGSALLASGIIMAIQRSLRLITDFRLLELLNPNEPILKRLMTDAPGSYQSSVMVGNLAEPAAEAIGANSLLARTCAMYHDIGKVKRPMFFSENQLGTENPHDHLSPHLSALVLMSHVKEGQEIAEDIGLPDAVAAAIPESHGTTLVSFLYRKALAEADDPDQVREADFHYDGPIPQSAETAIVML